MTTTAPTREATAATDPVAGPSVPGGRLVSLDAFRGLTIAAMLLVNDPGSWSYVYGPLRHAEWHGWTPTDLIFPFFLFIVGVAMTFSFGKRRREGKDRWALLRKAARRALVLFALGLLIHAFPWYDVDLATLRIPGVLQRIAVAYLAASAIVLFTGLRGQIVAAAALLLGYWALLALVPVPGGVAGDLTPDGNLAAWLDRTILGTDHLWSQSRTWDPEGILSTLPAVATVLSGVFTGRWLRSGRSGGAVTVGLLAAGVAAVAVGMLWGLFFPINKNLWTSSYTVFTSGMALLLLGLCYWVIDVRGLKRWATPFVVFGVNAIAAYFLSALFARVIGMIDVGGGVTLKEWAYRHLFASWAGPLNGSLAFAVAFVLLWLGFMWPLYRRRIYIKV
ncbi:MAG TPA: heparan-alpha-glucosaminide N-acetyltransferase domain-containing protein [Longimicrobiales bacterium]|nr:heparan-alpha-glucosaminide N-acetyltransferase domain-containing protein [Longimicrobiales bacterium]